MSPGDVIAILGTAAAFGGLIWQVRDLKDKVVTIDATATRSEHELIRLNAMLEEKVIEAATQHSALGAQLQDHEERLRSIERACRKVTGEGA